MKIQFDERGHLYPPRPIEITYEDFEQHFVTDIKESETRQRLFNNFNRFVQDFQNQISPNFKIWIDGSFISKKVNPRDIDAVFLLDYTDCERQQSILDSVWFSKTHKFRLGLDLYYSIEYPKTHKRHFISHLNHLYWADVYGHTRKDNTGKNYRKGFIELKFQ